MSKTSLKSFLPKASLFLIIELSTLFLTLVLIPLVKNLSIVNAQSYGGRPGRPGGPGPAPIQGGIPGSIDDFAVPPPVVPCLDVNYRYEDGTLETGYRNPEFHSLRPYQASPCGDAPKTFFCNNDYRIVEDVSQRWDPKRCTASGGTYICIPVPNATKCGAPSPTGGQACADTYIVGGQDGRDYAITLSKAMYPILGNTQNVFNSQSDVEEFDETGKMTEYVNWYLQGVPERAEYGRKYTDIRDQVTFAGPPKKLLPFDILNLARLEVLHDAGVKPPQEVDELYEGPDELVYYDPIKDGYYTRQTLNHNQIAVCTGGSIGDLPIPCYAGNGGKALGSTRRLVIWWESRGSTPTQTFFNWTINDVWGGQTPPFPWQFDDGYLYRKAFLEWTGKTCVPVPFGSTYVCISDGNRGLYSELYEFIPLGNNNDKNSAHKVEGVQVNGPGQTIFDLLGYSIEKNPTLHYPHTEATVQISKLLNEINTPLECTENEDATEKLPGEDLSCCPDGYYFNGNSRLGSCISNTIDSSCGNFGLGVCGLVAAVPGNLLACDVNTVSDICEANILISTSNFDPAAFCTNILSAVGLGPIAPLISVGCATLTQPLQNLLSQATIPPSCQAGLKCQLETGTCKNPDAIPPLSCKKITGKGTNYEPQTCEFAEIRVNPGDSLTFKDEVVKSYMFIDDVRIEVKQIECQNKGQLDTFTASPPGGCGNITWNICLTDGCQVGKNGCSACPPKGNAPPEECTSWPQCKAELLVVIPTSPKIPNITQIWRSTVIDKNTSFRRIFPKIEDGAPLACIKQIPSTTKLVYITNNDTNLVKINTAGPNVYPGNGPSSQSPAQIFFPHLGTIYEYFLKGIQSALRPKGFGQVYEIVQTDPETCALAGKSSPCTIRYSVPQGDPETCALTGDLGPCKQWLFEADPSGKLYYEKVIEAANSTSCSQGSLNPFWAVAIALNENGGLMSEDAQGRSSSHFGCNVNVVQTIEEKISCMVNTLRNDCGKPIETILQEYGYPAGYQMWPLSVLMGGVANPPYPPMFGSGFDTGQLVANLLGADWVAAYQSVAPIFCPNAGVLQTGTTGGGSNPQP